jgi:hypothetical protein
MSKEKVAKGWIRLHNEELYNIYASPRNITVIKSRRVRWAGHLTHKGEMKSTYKDFKGRLERRDHSEEPRRGLDESGSYGPMVGSC